MVQYFQGTQCSLRGKPPRKTGMTTKNGVGICKNMAPGVRERMQKYGSLVERSFE
jgi:hypothetical protein